MAQAVLIINGPNLNMLGKREPEIYGRQTLAGIEKACRAQAKKLGMPVTFFQSNAEGELIDRLHAAASDAGGVIINAGALTHTSIALLDALSILKCPIIEVHLSNIFRREGFRHHSYVSNVATGVICGLGAEGYLLALAAMQKLIK